MDEFIEKKKLVNRLKMWLMDLEDDMDKGEYGELCENKGAREAIESCICEVEEQPAADVQPISVIKELQEHIKQRILETAFNNGGIYGEVAEDIADRIDIWVDEFGRTKNG